MSSILAGLRSLLRRLRALRHRWSPEADRRYHDALFAGQDFDPFHFSYPGYLTIRRFADLVEPHLEACGEVADLGCGTGEITCELARRLPTVSFHGVDHSRAGIERAREHAERLELDNVRFQVGDVEAWEPPGAVDAVLLLDAFHHLMEPARFVERLRDRVPRFVLIEPRGDWKGSWGRDLDLDWIVSEIDELRARAAYETGLGGHPRRDRSPGAGGEDRAAGVDRGEDPGPEGDADHDVAAGPPGGAADLSRGQGAVENRYALGDLSRLFDGYGLRARGTVAGLETYPPDFHARGPLRERFGRTAYRLFRELDELLRERDLDLWAKHWVVRAERGQPDDLREPGRLPGGRRRLGGAGRDEARRPGVVASRYDVEYLDYEGPRRGTVGATVRGEVRMRNAGWLPWSSADPEAPIHLAYHWLDSDGEVVEFEGERSRLGGVVGAGEVATVAARIRLPGRPGRYRLAVDLVHEGRTWFSEAGSPPLEVPFRVTE